MKSVLDIPGELLTPEDHFWTPIPKLFSLTRFHERPYLGILLVFGVILVILSKIFSSAQEVYETEFQKRSPQEFPQRFLFRK